MTAAHGRAHASAPVAAGILDATTPTPAQRHQLAEFGLTLCPAPTSTTDRSFLAVARDGTALGAAIVRLAGEAEVWLFVADAARRTGLGGLLLHTVAGAADQQGYRQLYCTATDDTPAAAFLDAQGFHTESAINLLRLRLPAPPRSAPPPPGYQLRQWTGAPPEDLAPALLIAKRRSGDLPADGFPGTRTDPAKALHVMPNRVRRLGNILHTVAAVAESGGIVGYTELVVIGGTGRAEQQNTNVLAAHRGHALGRVLKIAMLDRIALLHPEVMEVDTENAADNGPMLAINTALGFRVISCTRRRWVEIDRLAGWPR